MPATTLVVREEAPCMPIVLIRHEHSYSVFLGWMFTSIFFPYYTQEEWTGGIHNCDIRQTPVAVVALQRFDNTEEERMSRYTCHDVV